MRLRNPLVVGLAGFVLGVCFGWCWQAIAWWEVSGCRPDVHVHLATGCSLAVLLWYPLSVLLAIPVGYGLMAAASSALGIRLRSYLAWVMPVFVIVAGVVCFVTPGRSTILLPVFMTGVVLGIGTCCGAAVEEWLSARAVPRR